MKLTSSALVLSVVALIMGVAKGDPSGDALPLSKIVAKVEKTYSPIVEASYDDGLWEIEAYRGDIGYEVLVSPDTGKIQFERREDAGRRPPSGAQLLSEILTGLERAGYSRFEEVSFETNTWEVEAYRGLRKFELGVDPHNGKVVYERRD